MAFLKDLIMKGLQTSKDSDEHKTSVMFSATVTRNKQWRPVYTLTQPTIKDIFKRVVLAYTKYDTTMQIKCDELGKLLTGPGSPAHNVFLQKVGDLRNNLHANLIQLNTVNTNILQEKAKLTRLRNTTEELNKDIDDILNTLPNNNTTRVTFTAENKKQTEIILTSIKRDDKRYDDILAVINSTITTVNARIKALDGMNTDVIEDLSAIKFFTSESIDSVFHAINEIEFNAAVLKLTDMCSELTRIKDNFDILTQSTATLQTDYGVLTTEYESFTTADLLTLYTAYPIPVADVLKGADLTADFYTKVDTQLNDKLVKCQDNIQRIIAEYNTITTTVADIINKSNTYDGVDDQLLADATTAIDRVSNISAEIKTFKNKIAIEVNEISTLQDNNISAIKQVKQSDLDSIVDKKTEAMQNKDKILTDINGYEGRINQLTTAIHTADTNYNTDKTKYDNKTGTIAPALTAAFDAFTTSYNSLVSTDIAPHIITLNKMKTALASSVIPLSVDDYITDMQNEITNRNTLRDLINLTVDITKSNDIMDMVLYITTLEGIQTEIEGKEVQLKEFDTKYTEYLVEDASDNTAKLKVYTDSIKIKIKDIETLATECATQANNYDLHYTSMKNNFTQTSDSSFMLKTDEYIKDRDTITKKQEDMANNLKDKIYQIDINGVIDAAIVMPIGKSTILVRETITRVGTVLTDITTNLLTYDQQTVKNIHDNLLKTYSVELSTYSTNMPALIQDIDNMTQKFNEIEAKIIQHNHNVEQTKKKQEAADLKLIFDIDNTYTDIFADYKGRIDIHAIDRYNEYDELPDILAKKQEIIRKMQAYTADIESSIRSMKSVYADTTQSASSKKNSMMTTGDAAIRHLNSQLTEIEGLFKSLQDIYMSDADRTINSVKNMQDKYKKVDDLITKIGVSIPTSLTVSSALNWVDTYYANDVPSKIIEFEKEYTRKIGQLTAELTDIEHNIDSDMQSFILKYLKEDIASLKTNIQNKDASYSAIESKLKGLRNIQERSNLLKKVNTTFQTKIYVAENLNASDFNRQLTADIKKALTVSKLIELIPKLKLINDDIIQLNTILTYIKESTQINIKDVVQIQLIDSIESFTAYNNYVSSISLVSIKPFDTVLKKVPTSIKSNTDIQTTLQVYKLVHLPDHEQVIESIKKIETYYKRIIARGKQKEKKKLRKYESTHIIEEMQKYYDNFKINSDFIISSMLEFYRETKNMYRNNATANSDGVVESSKSSKSSKSSSLLNFTLTGTSKTNIPSTPKTKTTSAAKTKTTSAAKTKNPSTPKKKDPSGEPHETVDSDDVALLETMSEDKTLFKWFELTEEESHSNNKLIETIVSNGDDLTTGDEWCIYRTYCDLESTEYIIICEIHPLNMLIKNFTVSDTKQEETRTNVQAAFISLDKDVRVNTTISDKYIVPFTIQHSYKKAYEYLCILCTELYTRKETSTMNMLQRWVSVDDYDNYSHLRNLIEIDPEKRVIDRISVARIMAFLAEPILRNDYIYYYMIPFAVASLSAYVQVVANRLDLFLGRCASTASVDTDKLYLYNTFTLINRVPKSSSSKDTPNTIGDYEYFITDVTALYWTNDSEVYMRIYLLSTEQTAKYWSITDDNSSFSTDSDLLTIPANKKLFDDVCTEFNLNDTQTKNININIILCSKVAIELVSTLFLALVANESINKDKKYNVNIHKFLSSFNDSSVQLSLEDNKFIKEQLGNIIVHSKNVLASIYYNTFYVKEPSKVYTYYNQNELYIKKVCNVLIKSAKSFPQKVTSTQDSSSADGKPATAINTAYEINGVKLKYIKINKDKLRDSWVRCITASDNKKID